MASSRTCGPHAPVRGWLRPCGPNLHHWHGGFLLLLLWQVVGTDAAFTNQVALADTNPKVLALGLPPGRTVNFKTRVSNSAGQAGSAVQAGVSV